MSNLFSTLKNIWSQPKIRRIRRAFSIYMIGQQFQKLYGVYLALQNPYISVSVRMILFGKGIFYFFSPIIFNKIKNKVVSDVVISFQLMS
jgi:hypothetical protein